MHARVIFPHIYIRPRTDETRERPVTRSTQWRGTNANNVKRLFVRRRVVLLFRTPGLVVGFYCPTLPASYFEGGYHLTRFDARPNKCEMACQKWRSLGETTTTTCTALKRRSSSLRLWCALKYEPSFVHRVQARTSRYWSPRLIFHSNQPTQIEKTPIPIREKTGVLEVVLIMILHCKQMSAINQSGKETQLYALLFCFLIVCPV